MAKVTINFEIWSGRRIIVVRSDGKFKAVRMQRGSGLKTKSEARDLYKSNRTLYRNVVKTELTNVDEVVSFRQTTLKDRYEAPVKRPSNRKKPQYVVSGVYGKKTVAARSFKLGTKLCETEQSCKAYAWRNFIYLLGSEASGEYDADEGEKALSKVKSLKEGWVYYQ